MAIFAPDVAIDLGTSNTLLYVRGRGIMINEPSILVTDAKNTDMILAVGDEARFQLGRTTGMLNTVVPMRDGTITDFDMASKMVRYYLQKAIGPSRLFRPRAVVAVPSSLSDVQRNIVQDAVVKAGCKQVYLIEKPYAAAIGTGLPVFEPTGSMIVDIGGGTTDAAVVSIGGNVISTSIEVGGFKMDQAIANYIKTHFKMIIGARTAEDVKCDLGTALPLTENRRIRIRGKDIISAAAKEIEFTSVQCYEALRDPCKAILNTIKWVLERTPPELASDVMRGGIHLTGGGAQLFALDQYIASELGIPVLLAKEPTDCTIIGLGYLLENMQLLPSGSRMTSTAKRGGTSY